MSCFVNNPADIRLGVIGMTPGNGHPYSWSAIINGFDGELMNRDCLEDGFRIYLNKVDSKMLGLPGVRVTHIACEGIERASHIAAISHIPQVCSSPLELLGQVDAVLLATDLADEQQRRAEPFVAAGMPIFIDKPLCGSMQALRYFSRQVQRGAPLLSSSSMRYAKELQPYHGGEIPELGRLQLISMSMPKQWMSYGIHALEAIYPITGCGYTSVQSLPLQDGMLVHLQHRRGIDVVISLLKNGVYGAPLQLLGTGGNLSLSYPDSFSAFKAQLTDFVQYLRTGQRPYDFQETIELIRLLLAAEHSSRMHHKKINLETAEWQI
ncbi:MAG: oxidoreductase [Lentisphaeria bacterium]